jgi:hexosaminidase
VPDFAHAQHALYPRLAALAELGWSPASRRDWDAFLERLPAELARYRALGIGFADSAFAPDISVSASGDGALRVAMSNQVNAGEIRYTTDGSRPTATSARYAGALEFPARGHLALRAATFGPGGFELAAPRAQAIDAAAVDSVEGSALGSCSDRPGMRLEGGAPAQGPRPVYTVYVGDMCWRWLHAPRSAGRVSLRIGRVAWRFGDEARDAIVRPKASAAGELELHADTCAGPLLARLPLPALGPGGAPRELRARVVGTAPDGDRDLCIFATGDPREGPWALARVAFSD